MSSLSCSFWWFLLGALLGWILHWLLNKLLSGGNQNHVTPTPPPVARVANITSPSAVKAPAPVKSAAPAVALIDLAAAKAAGFALKNANDLTIIEGIGPKINALFHNAGIKTFAQLAVASVPQMRKILDDGGSRFRMANPSTWTQQGALAAANKWVELKKLQDDLSGGVKK